MNKFKTIIIAVIAIIVVIVAGVAAEKYLGKPAPTTDNNYTAPTGTLGVGSPQTTSTQSGGPNVSVSLFKTYSGSSFSMHYPLSWNVFNTSPFAINNFGNYASDGSIPAGGAEIDIATTTMSGNLQAIIQTELMSAKNIKTSTVTIDRISCAEASYNSSFGPSIASDNLAIYCAKGGKLWKIYLSFRAGDQAASQHVNDLNLVLGSMKFLP